MKSWLALTLPVAVLSTVSCQQLSKAPTAEQEIEVFEFPNPLEIEDPNETGVFPPRPIGYQKASKPVFEEDPDVLRDNEANLLRQIAEETEQVREALGGRYGFITSGRTETEKERKTQVSEPMTTLTFYSYAFNKAIDVLMTGNTVTDNLVVPRGAVGKVVSRSWDDRILEIAVFSQIGDYDIYHAYYFDRAGTMEGRVYSRGWSDEETHRHHPYWRLDFDVEHPRNLPRLIRRTRSEVRRVVRIVLEELNYWQSRADVEPFRFFISSPAGRHVGVRNVGNASRDAAPGAPWFSFSTKDSGVRLWKGAEDRGWEFGSRGHLGYASPPEAWTRGEWQSGKDVVLWMVHHLDHAWIEGEDEEGREWHWTTVQIIPEW